MSAIRERLTPVAATLPHLRLLTLLLVVPACGGPVGEDLAEIQSPYSGYGNCPTFNDDQACVCQDHFYMGNCKLLDAGTHFYPVPSAFSPLPNDALSSVAIGQHVSLGLFLDDQMRNLGKTFGNADGGVFLDDISPYTIPNYPYTSVNDTASSLRLDRLANDCQHPGANQAALFVDANFSGDCTVLTFVSGVSNDYPSTTHASDANGLNGTFGLPNDSVSSVIVGSNRTLRLWTDGSLHGSSHDYTGRVTSLGSLDNTTSSVQLL